jgi:hypothetical protein
VKKDVEIVYAPVRSAHFHLCSYCAWVSSISLCAVYEKPYYGKLNFLPCGVCDARFHSNCLQTGVSETNVSASEGKSAYKCDSCIKLMVDTANEHFIAKRNQGEALSTESECTASRIGDNDSLCVQLEAVCVNGICTMEIVKSSVVMVSKLSNEEQQLRIDNEILKTQLRDLQESPPHEPCCFICRSK